VLWKKFLQLREYDLSLVHAGISFRRNNRAEGLPKDRAEFKSMTARIVYINCYNRFLLPVITILTGQYRYNLVDPEKLIFQDMLRYTLLFDRIEASIKFGAKSLLPTAAACGSSSQRRSEWH
jgi:hypothetical protein